MLDFIVTRCYTKMQIYFFVSVSRRSLPCISVVFFKSQNFRFCSSDCFPESLASGHVAWLQTNRYQRIDKANKRHSFYLELLFQNDSGAFAAEGFFYKPLPANGGFGKGQQTNLTRRNQKGGNYEIKRCTNCH